jgi:hypothetical protein
MRVLAKPAIDGNVDFLSFSARAAGSCGNRLGILPLRKIAGGEVVDELVVEWGQACITYPGGLGTREFLAGAALRSQ